MPSAMPRNSDSVPSVTMSGGIPSRATSAALSAPPAVPAARLISAATPTGRFQSRWARPKTTAASPIIAPTDRSMPPVTITGVRAIASRPNSTLSRVSSKKLPMLAKFGAIAENSAISATTASRRIHSLLGKTRPRPPTFTCQRPTRIVRRGVEVKGVASRSGFHLPRPHQPSWTLDFGRWEVSCLRPRGGGRRGHARPHRVDGDCRQDDRALQRALPVGADAEKGQRGTDRTEQDHAEQRPGHAAAAAGYRRAPDDDRGNHFHLEA